MPTIKGIAWDHPRGFDPMVATAKEYSKSIRQAKVNVDRIEVDSFVLPLYSVLSPRDDKTLN